MIAIIIIGIRIDDSYNRLVSAALRSIGCLTLSMSPLTQDTSRAGRGRLPSRCGSGMQVVDELMTVTGTEGGADNSSISSSTIAVIMMIIMICLLLLLVVVLIVVVVVVVAAAAAAAAAAGVVVVVVVVVVVAMISKQAYDLR